MWDTKVKLYGWKCLTFLLVCPIYVVVISEGLRIILPTLAQRLYKLPFLHSLEYYEGAHLLDIAHFLALIIFIAVSVLWEYVIESWIYEGIEVSQVTARMNAITGFLGFVILGADACLFYLAMASIGWGGARFSFSAVLGTLAYIAVLMFTSFMSVRLKYSEVQE